jgi:hypothetical protein
MMPSRPEKGGRYGLGAEPGLCHGDGGPRAAGAQEYLAAENRILKTLLKGRIKLTDAARATLGEIGHRLDRKVVGEVATVTRPDTILACYRKYLALLTGTEFFTVEVLTLHGLATY